MAARFTSPCGPTGSCSGTPVFVDCDGIAIVPTFDANGNPVLRVCANDAATTCVFTTQPTGIDGDPGTGVPSNFGAVATGPIQWQEGGSATGPWSVIDATPATITGANAGNFYRACCAVDVTTCSSVVQITTPTCRVIANPVPFSGPIGSPIPTDMGGSSTLAAQWQQAPAVGGPWLNIGGPPTEVTATNVDQFFRFCCISAPTVCSTAAQITIDGFAVITDPQSINGDPGTPIPTDMGGSSTTAATWQTAANPGGPWTTITGPPTVITSANKDQYFRFCSADLSVCSGIAQVTTPPCRVLVNPQSIDGDPGTTIPTDMGGSSTLAAQWQEAGAASGPWTNIAGPPTVITAQNDEQFFRFCCVEDPTVCSTAAHITTPPCRVIVQPQGATGPIGSTIPTDMGGQTTLPAQWQSSITATGPWTNLTGPPTTITLANAGLFYRFCCQDDSNVCSDVVQVIADPAAPAFVTTPTAACIDDQTFFCAECTNGTVTFQELINGVWTDV